MKPQVMVVIAAALLGACGTREKKSGADPATPAAAVSSVGDDRGEISVVRRGVVCDGETDDTDALQRVIDSARTKGGIGRRLVLPAGVCVVSKTIVIRGVAGFTLQGQGPMVSEIEWRGDATSPLLLLDHTYHAKLEDFSLFPGGKSTLKAGIRIENGPGCDEDSSDTCRQWPSTHATLSDLVVRGRGRIENGVHVALADPSKDRKNDHHRFERVQVTAYTGAAFLLEGRNAKGLYFSGCVCQGKTIGKACVDTTTYSRQGASFWWYGGQAAGNSVADFDIGDRNDTLLLSGVYSEKSARFLRVQDKADEKRLAYPVVVEAVRFATGTWTAQDNEVIQFLSDGPLTVTGCRWGVEGPRATPVKFRFDPKSTAGAQPGFVFTGNYVTGPEAPPFPGRQPSTFTGNVVDRKPPLPPGYVRPPPKRQPGVKARRGMDDDDDDDMNGDSAPDD